MTDLHRPEGNHPVAANTDAGTQTGTGEPDGSTKAAPIRVLYVDDEPGLLEIAKLFLEDAGDFTVTTVEMAPDALQLLGQEPFDAIISDYSMPVMDGLQFLAEVRARFGRIPFILFTGRGREEVVIQAIHSGVDFYIQKGGQPSAQFAELGHQVRQAVSRRRAEDSLRKSEEDYRHLIAYSDEAIGIIQDGIIRRVNASVVALTGYPEQELLSVPFSRFVHPDDLDMVTERYRKRMKGEEAPSQYSLRVIGKEGNTIWVDISTVSIGWEGRPATLTFLVDVTRRIQAEEAVVRARDALDRILNTIADPVFVKDEEHRRVLVNDAYCRFTRLAREEMINKCDQDLFPREQAENLTREDNLVLSSGAGRETEEQITDHNGEVHTVVTKKTLLIDGKGRRFIVGIARDITEIRRAGEAVIQTRRNYEAFFNNIDEFLFVLDEQGRILYTNETIFRRLGYTKEELTGRSVLEVHPPERRGEAGRIVQEMLAGTRAACPVPLVAKDGRLIPVETRVTKGEWDGKPVLFGVSKETM
jgi:PAS domain S-box-containing protein